jgi:hypothetical protein
MFPCPWLHEAGGSQQQLLVAIDSETFLGVLLSNMFSVEGNWIWLRLTYCRLLQIFEDVRYFDFVIRFVIDRIGVFLGIVVKLRRLPLELLEAGSSSV